LSAELFRVEDVYWNEMKLSTKSPLTHRIIFSRFSAESIHNSLASMTDMQGTSFRLVMFNNFIAATTL